MKDKLISKIKPVSKHFRKENIAKTFLFGLLIFFLLPKQIFKLPEFGIDPSWMLSLNLAIRDHLVFGKEHIFTYGPLGYLHTGLSVYTSAPAIILFYLFIVSNAIYFIYYLYKRIQKTSERLVLSITLVFFGNFLFGMDTLSLYLFIIFHFFHFLRYKNLLSYITVSACCLLSFYIKVNTGILVNILFVFFVIYNILFKTSGLKLNLIFLLSHFLLLHLMSLILNTDIVSYIKNSLRIIDTYNDAVVLPARISELISACLILGIALLTISLSFRKILRSNFEFFMVFNLSIMGYILFKQGFVRADEHVYDFFTAMIFVFLLALLFTEIEKFRDILFPAFILTLVLGTASFRDQVLLEKLIFNAKSMVFNEKENQVPEDMKLPERILKEIGNKSVDVLGWEISYIYYNNFKYNPRPVIQSYTAYNKSLIDINCEKYNNADAPDYVLYHFNSIDNRHPFWDEPKIYLSLLRNYTIFDTISTSLYTAMILFKKTGVKKPMHETMILDTLVNMNSKITVPHSDNILYLELDYDYSVPEKIRRFFFQPHFFQINLYYDSVPSTTHNLVLPIMKSGVPINKKLTDYKEAYDFFNTGGRNNGHTRFFEIAGNKKWLKGPLRIRIFEYKIGLQKPD